MELLNAARMASEETRVKQVETKMREYFSGLEKEGKITKFTNPVETNEFCTFIVCMYNGLNTKDNRVPILERKHDIILGCGFTEDEYEENIICKIRFCGDEEGFKKYYGNLH